jgi:hypothetical protein
MDFTAQKAQCNATPDLPKWVSELIVSAEKLAVQARELAFENEKFKHELAYLRRMRYGAKTEALSAVNLDLFEEHFTSDAAAIAADMEKRQAQLDADNAAKPKLPRQRAGRQPLPPHLPRTDIVHPLVSCDCGACGNAMVKIGEDKRGQLIADRRSDRFCTCIAIPAPAQVRSLPYRTHRANPVIFSLN